MVKIAVTGASGFVGTNLLAYFSKNLNFDYSPLDLRKPFGPASLASKDIIIHLAGKAHDLKNPNDEDAYFQVNTVLTRDLFDLFLQSDARDFIYFSSVKAASDSVAGVLTEDVVPVPYTSYGKSKLAAEEYILSKSLPANKRVFIIRPCMIHGPGNKGNLNLLYKIVSKGIPYPLAAFDNRRSFLSVENLAYVIEKIIEKKDVPGGIYNLTDDEPLSTTNVIRLMSQALGKKPRLLHVSQAIVRRIAKLGNVLHLPLNSERLKKMTESYVVSNSKIKQALNINKLPISSRDGLLATIRSFQNN